ncbi:TonB-dependent receptor [Chitinophaga horti]|uniref:TonB-dependent receptor n=1 Tax=Chitinophaga horti TaxID=2920382 RepID=A0ABY6J6Y8_9BACT|nr:TonB-dependent receptor [Chitinophaga horti]UYQ94061.1 TonB-dependent receptor [Chitinophaga horti]
MNFYTFCKQDRHAHIRAAWPTTRSELLKLPELSLKERRQLQMLLRTMKLITFLLFAACMHVSAKTWSQSVTFSGSNVPLSKVLNVVKKQTGYAFFYNRSILRDKGNVTVNAVNEPLELFLKDVLEEQMLDYSIENKVIIISRATPKINLADTADVKISGRITDDAGNPLPGVSIKVKGTSRGTTTNSDGVYSLANIAENSVLEISYIGFASQEAAVKGKTAINFQLKPFSKDIEGVTVVGYSTKNVKYLSSAVSTVSGDQLRDVTSNSVTNMLQGKAAGVVVSGASGDPTVSGAIQVRGQSTISAGSAPLIVVDGNIGGSYNPTDVASITVLKDAAATGLYGSRAANGVIIITTKSGKAGKTRIDVSASTGFAKATNGNFKLMNSQQLYDYQQTFTTRADSVLKTNTDWFDVATRNALVQNYTLSASGGSDKTQFYVSGNLYKEEGVLLQNSRTAYNFRTNIEHKLTDKLKMAVLLNGIYTKNNAHHSSTLYSAYINLPWDNPYNTDGSIRFPGNGGWLGRDQHNFLYSLQYNQSNGRVFNMNGDLNLDYAVTKHITISSYNRTSLRNAKSMSYNDRRTKEGTADLGVLYNDIDFTSTLLTSNRARYENSFGDHNLSVLGVWEAEKRLYDVNSVSGRGLPAGMTAMSTATEVKNSPTGGRNEYSFQKSLVQGDYNFANKYFLIGSFVHDVSSKFGNNNPGGNFYQLGASWILSQENFLRTNNAISFLKLRVSHGTVGNPPADDYQALGLYMYDQTASYAGQTGSYPSQKANPNLTWEKIMANNLGLELGLYNRINLTVDVYDKRAKSLLMYRPLPLTSGYTSVLENIGSINNKGVEVTLVTRNLVGEFKWETNFNLAANRNKVTKLNMGDKFASPGAAQPVGLGEDMDKWYMRVWAGVDPTNGDPLWEKIVTDADGKQYLTYTNSYNAATLQYTGNSSAPKFTGGMLNTFSYKGFSLSAFMNFVYGNYVMNNMRQFFDSDGIYDSYNQMVLAEGWSRWTKPGDIATHPKPLLGGNKAANEPSSRFLEDGSYVRLRNVTLAYDLPADFLRRARINNARVFVSGDNLWTGTRFSGTDPEVNVSGGYSDTKYPISKKFMLGVSIGF